jgi:hypothetical protein
LVVTDFGAVGLAAVAMSVMNVSSLCAWRRYPLYPSYRMSRKD